MAGTSKEHFWHINSSGQLVTGSTITARAVGGSVDLFTFSEPDTINHPGLYVLVADTGVYDIYVNAVLQAHISPWLHIDSDVIPVPVAGATNMFGDGSDGTYTFDGVQGSVAGLFTKSDATNYYLLRDIFFQDLTVDAGITLRGAGYRIFVAGTATIEGTIKEDGFSAGGNGANGSGGTGGAGGTLGIAGAGGFYLAPRPGIVGGAGGNSGFSGNSGGNGTASNPALGLGNAGAAGGVGGAAGANQGNGGSAGGSVLPALYGGIRHIMAGIQGRLFSASAVVSYTAWGGNGGAGGGGSGGGGTGTPGGGGGGGGGGGDASGLLVAAATLTGAGSIHVNGSAGGNGGNGAGNTGTAGGGGGGGGGNGGNGGWLTIVFNNDDGWTGTKTANAGAAGAGGTGGVSTAGTNGNAGSNGTAGKAGVVGYYQV